MGAVVVSTSSCKQEAEAKAAAYDRRLRSAQQVVEQLKAGIASLFQTAVGGHGLDMKCRDDSNLAVELHQGAATCSPAAAHLADKLTPLFQTECAIVQPLQQGAL